MNERHGDSLLARLRRRKLGQWSAAYSAAAWLFYQLLDAMGEPWGVTDRTLILTQIAMGVGLSLVAILAWFHGDRGRQKVSVPEVVAIGVVLAAGVGALRAVPRTGLVPDRTTASQTMQLVLDRQQRPTTALDVHGEGSLIVMSIADSAGTPRLWLKQAEELKIQEVHGSAAAIDPSFSSDGRWLGFIADGEVRVVSVPDGLSRSLTEPGTALCCVSWDPTNEHIYYTEARTQSVGRVGIRNGRGPETVLPLPEGEREGYMHFRLLADGERAIYGRRGGTIEFVNLISGETGFLTEGVRPFVTPNGYLIFARLDGQLYAARLHEDELRLGPAVPVLPSVGRPPSDGEYSLSASGALVYWTGGQPLTEPVWVTRDGSAHVVDSTWVFPGGSRWDLSPDEARLVVTRRGIGVSDVWVKDLPRGVFRPLVTEAGADSNPHWLDSETIIYRADRRHGSTPFYEAFSRAADGTGPEERLLDVARSVTDVVVRGGWLIVRTAGGGGSRLPEGSRDVIAISLDTDSIISVAASPDDAEMAPALSPAGDRIAYSSNTSGQHEVMVRPFPDVEEGFVQVSVRGGIAPKWSADGTKLYYVEPTTRTLVEAELAQTGSLEVVSRNELFIVGPEYTIGAGATSFLPTRDGRFLMMRRHDTQPALVFATGWTNSLPQLVPG